MKTTRYRYLLQKRIEETFGKRFIVQKAIDDLLTEQSIVNKLNKGVEILYSWFNEEHEIDKQLRLLALQQIDLPELVQHTVALVALHCSKPMKLVSIASMCIGHLKMADKVAAITTMAEVIAMLSDTDLFDCRKTSNGWVVVSRIGLDEEVLRYAYNTFYLPPLIIKPRTVRHNRDSGYITQRGESLILGYYEAHLVFGINLARDCHRLRKETTTYRSSLILIATVTTSSKKKTCRHDDNDGGNKKTFLRNKIESFRNIHSDAC
jgi:hypothetical protein